MTVSLKRRLDRVILNRPSHPTSEQLSAYAELIAHLDHLALRKAQGDAGVQQEIELICQRLHEGE